MSASGRTRALLCGRTVPRRRPARGRAALVAFYGQHESRKLTVAGAQLELLDGFCGAEAPGGAGRRSRRRARAGAAARGLAGRSCASGPARGTASSTCSSSSCARSRRPRRREAEEAELRRRARAAAAPRGAARRVASRRRRDRRRGAFDGRRARRAATAARRRAERELDGVQGVDAGARSAGRALPGAGGRGRRPRRRAAALRRGARGRARAARGRRGAPGGAATGSSASTAASIAAVLAHAERCRERRDELAGAEVALEEATAAARARRGPISPSAPRRCARRAPRRRRSWPPACASGWPSWRWRARRSRSRSTDREPGPDGRRRRRVPHRAEPGRPRRAAARDRVGRRAVARDARAARHGERRQRRDARVRRGRRRHRRPDRPRGRRAAARRSPTGRQVLCITHLPQIASLGDRHFSIAKDTSVEPARTTVTELREREVVGELVRMLGADDDRPRRAPPRAGAAQGGVGVARRPLGRSAREVRLRSAGIGDPCDVAAARTSHARHDRPLV